MIGQSECTPGWGRIFTTGLTIIGNNSFAFSEELLELGRRFSGFFGKKIFVRSSLKMGSWDCEN